MKIFAIANQKGGVGKTTTALNLGYLAALAGRRVLIIDLDPQGNAGDGLGLAPTNQLTPWLLGNGFFPTRAREFEDGELWVIQSDRKTADLKTALQARGFSEYAIRNGLEEIGGGFDLVLLDCAPSIDILHKSALLAAHWLIIPVQLENFAAKGINELLGTLASLARYGGACQVGGVLPVAYAARKTEKKAQYEHLLATFGNLVWPAIPEDTSIDKSHRAGQVLLEYDKKTRAYAQGYALVFKRFMDLTR